MTALHIFVLLLSGIAAGFSTGLMGIGAGFIIVPAQFWILTSMGIDQTIAIRVALGTNLLVVLPTGTLGVAGGGIYVLIMVFVLKFSMHQAVATSMVAMVFSAAGGAFSFLVNGLGVEGLPPYSLGYLNWLQWVLISAGSIPMASVGAKLAHQLRGKTIQYIFACVLFFLGLRMTGFLEWLNLPL